LSTTCFVIKTNKQTNQGKNITSLSCNKYNKSHLLYANDNKHSSILFYYLQTLDTKKKRYNPTNKQGVFKNVVKMYNVLEIC